MCSAMWVVEHGCKNGFVTGSDNVTSPHYKILSSVSSVKCLVQRSAAVSSAMRRGGTFYFALCSRK